MITFTCIRNNPGWLLQSGRAVISLVIPFLDHTAIVSWKNLIWRIQTACKSISIVLWNKLDRFRVTLFLCFKHVFDTMRT